MRAKDGDESGCWLTYIGCLMDEKSHHGLLPSVLAKGAQCGVGKQLELADDLPGEAASSSPACSSYPLCFDVSISPHPICTQLPGDARAGAEGFSWRIYDSS